MKKKITLVFMLLSLSLAIIAQDYSKMRGSEICATRKQNMQTQLLKSSPGAPKHSFDVLNYTLDLDLFNCYSSPYPKSFNGTNTVTFKVDSVLSSIVLNAVNSSLQINSVGGNGVSFTHELNLLNIVLDRTYQVGEIAEVTIGYSHKNVTDNAFYVSNGYVFTDSEPRGARKWFPCYDEPSDKATLQLRAKVPLNVKLGSNGRLADSVVVADSLWYTWISRDPIATYIMVISSRVNYNLDIVHRINPNIPNDTLPIRFYYNPGENPSNIKAMIVPLTDLFVSYFGEHPFEKDGFATVGPQFTWGGMENQSLTSLCPNCWYESLIAHEFAHQWFGDMITCATWADLWLNEGFATYVESLWTDHIYGHDAYVEEIEYNASYYLSNNPGWAISNPEWAFSPPSNNVLFNYAITYMKASTILYMYRNVVGDSLFFHSLYEYANDTVNFRYKSATINDFIVKMNESTGLELDWFFNQWLFTPNHPVYNSVYDIIETDQNQWRVNLNINQTQTNTGIFTMPVQLRVKFANSNDTLFTVMNDANNQHFSFYFDEEPLSLEFDPNNLIVTKQASLTVSNNQMSIPDQFTLQVLPNPSNGIFNLVFESNVKTTIDINIVNPQGTLVKSIDKVALSIGNNTIPIQASNLKPGTYVMSIGTSNYRTSQKLVIIK